MAEVVREQIFHLTHQEVPYAAAVRVEELTERAAPERLVHPGHDLRRARLAEGHPHRQGRRRCSSASARAARRELEAFFGIKVFLELHVQVRRNWRKDDARAARVRLPADLLTWASARSAAVVIGSFPLGESDRVVSFFSRDFGKVRGVAKAARRMRSRFGGALELFTLGQLVFFDTGRSDLVRIDHFDVIHPFAALREDLERLGEAAWIVECVGAD